MNIKSFSYFLAIIVTFLGLFSCSSDQEKIRVRIVDLKGNAKPILTKTPEFNARVLEGVDVANIGKTNKATQEQQATTIVPETRPNYPNQQIAQTIDAPVLNSPNKNNQDSLKSKEKANMVFSERPQGKTVEEYDLASSKDDLDDSSKVNKNSDPQLKESKQHKKNQQQSKKNPSISEKKYFVQTGSYSSQEVADQELKDMKKFARGKIEKVEMSDRITYRVLLGPYTNKAQARKMVNKIVGNGHEAILVKGQ
ncbi:hypothetical protein LBMAG18_11140 [Alphaproteobacteria bacterium]|nr:hypothetical protein LBMAG18_11140 [Alphaproteobacteria bacterium]